MKASAVQTQQSFVTNAREVALALGIDISGDTVVEVTAEKEANGRLWLTVKRVEAA